MSGLEGQLDKAQRVFEDGKVMRAARIVSRVRREAIRHDDAEAVDEVDALVGGMRAHLQGAERTDFDAIVARQTRPRTRLAAGTSERTRARDAVLWITVVAIVLMVIGALGPWATALGVAVDGTAGSNHGWIVVTASVVAGICLIGYVKSGSEGLCLLAALAGLGSFAAGLDARRNLRDLSGLPGVAVQVGWGLDLAIVASAALVILGGVLFARAR
jgi:hypothetical protein